MKNELVKNPFFYTTLALATLLVFELSGVVSAQQYQGPTAAPTGGMPAAPLHAGAAAQVKKGNFAVSATGVLDGSGNVNTGVQINAGSQTIWFRDVSSQARLYLVPQNGGELWVQHGTAAGVKIGVGTGEGTATGWTLVGSSGIYTGYNVGIGVANPTSKLEVGGEFVVSRPTITNELAWVRTESDLASLPAGVTLKMACDTASGRDCQENIRGTTTPPSVSLAVGCGSSRTCGSNAGEKRYDVFVSAEVSSAGGGKIFTPFLNVAHAVGENRYDIYTLQEVGVLTGGGSTPVFMVTSDGKVQMTGWSGGMWLIDKWVANGREINCTAEWGGGYNSVHYAKIEDNRLKVRVVGNAPGSRCDSNWVTGREARCRVTGGGIEHTAITNAPGFSGVSMTAGLSGRLGYGSALGGIHDLVGIQIADDIQACTASF